MGKRVRGAWTLGIGEAEEKREAGAERQAEEEEERGKERKKRERDRKIGRAPLKGKVLNVYRWCY